MVQRMMTRSNADRDRPARRIANVAMLFAMALLLSWIEGLLPPPLPVPGVKYGLSNIAVLMALMFWDGRSAFSIVVLKGVFAFLLRGHVAGLLSLAGGSLAFLAMWLLVAWGGTHCLYPRFGCRRAAYIGQYILVRLLYQDVPIASLLPLLLLSGTVAGALSAIVFRAMIPLLQKTGIIDNHQSGKNSYE